MIVDNINRDMINHYEHMAPTIKTELPKKSKFLAMIKIDDSSTDLQNLAQRLLTDYSLTSSDLE